MVEPDHREAGDGGCILPDSTEAEDPLRIIKTEEDVKPLVMPPCVEVKRERKPPIEELMRERKPWAKRKASVAKKMAGAAKKKKNVQAKKAKKKKPTQATKRVCRRPRLRPESDSEEDYNGAAPFTRRRQSRRLTIKKVEIATSDDEIVLDVGELDTTWRPEEKQGASTPELTSRLARLAEPCLPAWLRTGGNLFHASNSHYACFPRSLRLRLLLDALDDTLQTRYVPPTDARPGSLYVYKRLHGGPEWTEDGYDFVDLSQYEETLTDGVVLRERIFALRTNKNFRRSASWLTCRPFYVVVAYYEAEIKPEEEPAKEEVAVPGHEVIDLSCDDDDVIHVEDKKPISLLATLSPAIRVSKVLRHEDVAVMAEASGASKEEEVLVVCEKRTPEKAVKISGYASLARSPSLAAKLAPKKAIKTRVLERPRRTDSLAFAKQADAVKKLTFM